MRKIVLVIVILVGYMTCLIAQKNQNNNLATKKGILIFEGKKNVFSISFLETTSKNFASLIYSKDTFKIIDIGTPGDDVNNVVGEKDYLSKTFHFDSLQSIVIIENNQGMYIEDTCMMYYTNGFINYAKTKGFKLEKKYEKKRINNKTLIFDLEYFIPINSFESDKPPILKKSIRRKYKKK